MEFLVAIFPRGAPDYLDPHPEDERYLSEKFTDLARRIGPDEFQWGPSVTNYSVLKLIKQLRLNDIAAHNPHFIDDCYCEYSDSENEETADWDGLIKGFGFGIKEDPSKDRDFREFVGYRFFEEFKDYCERHSFDMRLMKPRDTDNAADRMFNILQEPPNSWVDATSIADVADEFHTSVLREVKSRKEAARDILKIPMVDPDHVPADGLHFGYKGWLCTTDGSVNGAGMGPGRYHLPKGRKNEVPMSEYWWLGAEINSPCYPHHSEKTAENIRRTCGVLRDYFRTHKPMELSSGLHVHLGHKHGFNLLQVKRFVTLWLMIEDTLMQCHRKDRDQVTAGRWCARLYRETGLSRWLFANSLPDRLAYACEPRPLSEQARQADIAALEAHVPMKVLQDDFQLFLNKIWTYPTLTDLSYAMRGADGNEPGARIRVEGGKTSTPARQYEPQTIEIRTMHGTLDADHINQWIVVLGCLMHYVRDVTAEEFKAKLTEILDAEEEDGENPWLWRLLQVLEVPEETRRFFLHPYHRATFHGNNKDYFVYPDRDRVDWEEPFNEPGHGATHGAQWDKWHTFP
ncbi:hypothetical protein F4806DRAFT_271382 [Annulohypoxylon nitens]|nr:hypothetical protein F4806DRAFT_271382 [Annulohypoxylon nitens]